MSLSLGDTKENTITVLAIESLPTHRVPRIAATFLRSGDLGRVPGFRLWRDVDEVHLEATPAVNGQADGELTGAWTEARLTLRPQALRVITPPD